MGGDIESMCCTLGRVALRCLVFDGRKCGLISILPIMSYMGKLLSHNYDLSIIMQSYFCNAYVQVID